jgi:hypothetical protein
MSKTALAYKEDAAPVHKVIELSLTDRFPVLVRINDKFNREVGTYWIVKTKNDRFMFQK